MTADVKLGRATVDGSPAVLVQVDGVAYRLADLLPDSPGDLDAVFADWDRYAGQLTMLDISGARAVEIVPMAFLAPVERPKHLICIGTNYVDHIAEMRIPSDPEFPYAFLKPITTIAPPAGPVILPAMSTMVDWEAELGVVIGRRARDVAVDDALACVAGYLPLNDVSARDWIESRPSLGIDWVMQKAFDGFNPLGPWITLASSVADPQAIPVRCSLNGELMQDSSTEQMLFSVAEIVAHLSSIMTLSAGDVIATGTPAGVGFGRSPRRFIKAGDVVQVSLGQLGAFETAFVAPAAADTRARETAR